MLVGSLRGWYLSHHLHNLLTYHAAWQVSGAGDLAALLLTDCIQGVINGMPDPCQLLAPMDIGKIAIVANA